MTGAISHVCHFADGETLLFVGGDEASSDLADYIASMRPDEREDRAGGFVDPHDTASMLIPVGNGRFARIDVDDYPLVRGHTWSAQPGGYACTINVYGGRRHHLRMHRLVHMLGHGGESVVDHSNHDRLDNRKANLRVCKHRENCRNQRLSSLSTTGVKGVSRYFDRFKATVKADGVARSRYFDSIGEADAWARAMRLQMHGEFACHG